MKRLTLILLAASALIPVAGAAQTAAPPVRWEDSPETRLNAPAPPRAASGVTWRQAPVVRAETRKVGPHRVEMRAAPHQQPAARQVVVQHRGDMNMHRGDMRDHRRGRIDKGGSVHSFFWGPRFVIRDWNRYGFSRPFDGGRWIRYYDDALLIDRDGRVRDGRYGMDWDRYGERWSRDDHGVPGYDGDRDSYAENDRDYDAYDDRSDYDDYDDRGGYDDDARGGQYGHDERVMHGGAAYGHYGYGQIMTITETTVTEPATVTSHTYYEDAKPRRKAKHYKPRCHCPPAHAATPHHAPRPAPRMAPKPRYDGERG